MRRLLVLPICLALAVAGCAQESSDTSVGDPVITTAAVDTPSSTGEATTTEPDVATTVADTSSGQTTTTAATMGIQYTVDSGRKLDVYTPGEPGPWPVVVVVHGYMQSKFPFAPLAEAIASEGAVVFNIDVDMTFPFQAAIEQIACAVRFSRAMAADYGGDDTRITLVGNSSGAATGVIVATAGDDFVGDCVVTEGSALVDAVVGYEGVYDHAIHNYALSVEEGNLPALKKEDPELWETVNPYSHIGSNPDLVVRLIHGDDTDVEWYEVPRQVSVEFHQALAEAGYDAELTLLDGPSHIGLITVSSKAFEDTVQQVMQVASG